MRFYFLYIVLGTLLHAQSYDYSKQSKSIFLSGKIINIVNGSPIEYASVSLLNSNNKEIIMGQLSDVDGSFIFRNMRLGDYIVQINFMGFKDWESEIISIASIDDSKDLGIIELTFKALSSEDVSITATKEVYEFKADKLVYNPDNDIVASAGTAEDVLNRAPMVTVDQDGEIQLRGNSNVNILVDGRKNRIDLANISGSQIEKVEVITSPSAKYDPEGMGGIINIVLKKGTNDGFNGNIQMRGQHNTYHSFDKINGLSFYGNYKKNKINFFSSGGVNNRFKNSDGYRFVTKEWSDSESFENINIQEKDFYNSFSETERKTTNIRLGLDYYLLDDMTITNEFKYSKPDKITFNNQEYLEPAYRIEETRDQKSDNNYDLSYLFEFNKEFKDPEQSLDFSINIDRDVDEEVKDLINNNIVISSAIQNENYTGTEIDLSYKQPIGEKLKYEIGYQGKLQDNSSTLDFNSNIIDTSSTYIITNESQLNRDIHAIYLELENDFNDKFSIKPSFRLEHVNKKVNFITNFTDTTDFFNTPFDNLLRDSMDDVPYNYNNFEFYPYLNFTYNITKNENIQFGFGKRINRPNSWNSRPFARNIYNETFVFVGNPTLEPEYSTQYDINYSRPIPMGFASLNLFYHEITNKHEWLDSELFGGDILTFENVDNAWSKGFSIFTMIMGQTLGGGYTATDQADSDNPNSYEYNESSERLNMYGKIKFPEKYIKIFDFEFGFYWMKMILPSGDLFGNKGTIWADLGISKKFMDKKLTASFTIDNIFDGGGFKMKRTKPIDRAPDPNLTENFEDIDPADYIYGREFSDVNNTRNGRTFKLTLKYQIGKKIDDKKGGNRGGGSGGGMMDMGY